jgi:hypothetical protein
MLSERIRKRIPDKFHEKKVAQIFVYSVDSLYFCSSKNMKGNSLGVVFG